MNLKGIEIIYNDDTKDLYDPVDLDKNGVIEKDGLLKIDNGYRVYIIELSKIKSYSYYDLCQKCLFDIKGCRCEEKEQTK